MTADDQPGQCPRCLCDDCGGRLDQHTADTCTCDSCQFDPQYACRLAEFARPERVRLLAQQLGPLLSAHLDAKHQRRCLAVAHVAHHALLDYDHPEDAR
jgi:predicted amidophosphoribosyltransferase